MSGIATYQLRFRRGATGRALSAWSAPRSTTHTAAILALSPGHTLCVTLRAQDGAGNRSSWSGARCVGRATGG